MTPPLFDPQDLPEPPTPAQAAQSMPPGKPRLRLPQRDQIEFSGAQIEKISSLFIGFEKECDIRRGIINHRSVREPCVCTRASPVYGINTDADVP